MLIRFSHVMVFSQKHEESIKWYCEKLGYEVDYCAPGEYASLHHKSLGKIAIHCTDNSNAIGNGPMPYLLCEDIHQTIKDLRAKGVDISEPTLEGESPWFTSMRDIDGNYWGIEER